MPSDIRIPIIEEEAHVSKRNGATEHVRVHTRTVSDNVLVHEALLREHFEVTRVPVEREVAEAPEIRTDGEFTIVPVLEERLVVEKRLFVVEELHLRRSVTAKQIELPVTLRRTEVEVERDIIHKEEDI